MPAPRNPCVARFRISPPLVYLAAVILLCALLAATTAAAAPEDGPAEGIDAGSAEVTGPFEPDAGAQLLAARPRQRRPEPEPEPALRVEVGGGAEVGVGVAPGATLGARAELGLRFETLSVSLEVHGGYAAPAHLVPATRSVSGGLGFGLLAVCVHLGDITLCAVGGGGAMRSQITGVSPQVWATTPLAVAGGRVAYDIPVGDRFRVRASLDVCARLAEARLTVGGRPAWVSGIVSGAFGLSLLTFL